MDGNAENMRKIVKRGSSNTNFFFGSHSAVVRCLQDVEDRSPDHCCAGVEPQGSKCLTGIGVPPALPQFGTL